ncbi:hypothetical protein [Streptomyces sp. FIT100]|uniref:hypothetical protein n=1 Tax=Streptomyces sp. FIT100 TaxID=2837956 RepID=UPI0021C58CD9|nr:hypothetical protein [Streptomyces sp. FIT100]UUN27899.1 hypothetical protein KK483_17005 [Streptomyces sp. FIT100]
MTASVALNFEVLAENKSHDNLRLRLGSYRHTCDSFYLDVDDTTTASSDLRGNLARLLEQWRNQVDGLWGAGGTAYLPYEFSDECTGWLRVSSADGRNAAVQAGWSPVNGWSFAPSDYLATAPEITDFEPEANAQIECALDDLSQCIARNAETFTASRQ